MSRGDVEGVGQSMDSVWTEYGSLVSEVQAIIDFLMWHRCCRRFQTGLTHKLKPGLIVFADVVEENPKGDRSPLSTLLLFSCSLLRFPPYQVFPPCSWTDVRHVGMMLSERPSPKGPSPKGPGPLCRTAGPPTPGVGRAKPGAGLCGKSERCLQTGQGV